MDATAAHLDAAKMYSLASCVMLFYDIAITFGDEVDKIWMQPFTGATVLWFMNRYIPPLGYIVIIVSFQDPNWSDAACRRYILYPEALKLVITFTINAIFILRLYAIYSRDRRILGGMTALLLAELAVKIWAFTDGAPVKLPPTLFGCILTARDNPSKRFIFSWVAELIFDTVVFALTLYKTLGLYWRVRSSAAGSLITVFLRDGIMYYVVIFGANLLTVILLVDATPDLKAVNASFSTLITSLMISRLLLNLRRARAKLTNIYHEPESMQKDLVRTVIGNLGNPIGHWGDGYTDDSRHHGGADRSLGEHIELRTKARRAADSSDQEWTMVASTR